MHGDERAHSESGASAEKGDHISVDTCSTVSTSQVKGSQNCSPISDSRDCKNEGVDAGAEAQRPVTSILPQCLCFVWQPL